MSDRITRFFNCLVPIYKCNLKCSYCYLQQRGTKNCNEPEYPHSPKEIATALEPNKVGGVSLINLCASGETLLGNKTSELIQLLLEQGHYVSIVTNLTIPKSIRQIAEFDGRERLFFKCSFHYIQLKKKKLIGVFFDNIRLLRQANISYTIEIVADDNANGLFDEIIDVMRENDEANPQVLECRIDPQWDIPVLAEDIKKHVAAWERYRSDLYETQQKLWGKRIDKFCYAGELSAEVNLATGELMQCIGTRVVYNIFDYTGSRIDFCAIGENCRLSHCFIAYVWQALCGNVEEISIPTYAQLRNRKRPDGSEWLNEVVGKAFGNRCIDSIKKYSEDRKLLCTYIFRLYHDGIQALSSVDEPKVTRIILDLFNSTNRNIVIYGMGAIGRSLFKILCDSGKTVVTADQNSREIRASGFADDCMSPDELIDYIKDDDTLVLITTFIEKNRIKSYLQKNTKDTVIWDIYDLIKMVQ